MKLFIFKKVYKFTWKHILHWKGFSPVWVISCAFNEPALKNDLNYPEKKYDNWR